MRIVPDSKPENLLYYGDNLDVLRRYIKDESVDLVYLDPPFNSDANYNVLFKEQNGLRAASQIKAFEDTWIWDTVAAVTYQEVVETGGKVSNALQAIRQLLGDNNMLAYLTMMAPRLVELRRVLNSTGTIYLHCDPTASHYLKILMDAVFGPERFVNEIVWQRTNAKGLAFTRFASNHDIIFRYSKSGKWTWNAQYSPHDPVYVEKFYRFIDPGTGRRYRLGDLANPNKNRPNLTYEFLGVTRVWRWTKERMKKAHEQGLVIQSRPGAVPVLKRYLDEQEGTPVGDTWTDIRPVQSQAGESLGYQTQKPDALLERIIEASSNKGDTILDPFCGCGTAISVAHRLKRRWIGIDITHLAITLMKHRLHDAFQNRVSYNVIGEPVSLPDAEALAEQDPYQFQWWALGLVHARPVEQKKGSDKGIDGQIYFHDEGGNKTKQVIISVKAGHANVAHVRDLRGVLERENAAIGVLISMEETTQPMRTEAAGAGFYHSPGWNNNYPKIQLLTIAELLDNKNIDMPPIHQVNATFKSAPLAETNEGHQISLDIQ